MQWESKKMRQKNYHVLNLCNTIRELGRIIAINFVRFLIFLFVLFGPFGALFGKKKLKQSRYNLEDKWEIFNFKSMGIIYMCCRSYYSFIWLAEFACEKKTPKGNEKEILFAKYRPFLVVDQWQCRKCVPGLDWMGIECVQN